MTNSVCIALVFALSVSHVLGQEPQQPQPSPAESGVAARAPRGAGSNPMTAAVGKIALSAQAELKAELPPLPEGVEELKFADFYKMPMGPMGMEMTERLKSLEGKKVRLSGFFVFEDWSACNCAPEPAKGNPNSPAARRAAMQPKWMKHVVPGRIMLSPLPVSVSLGHFGLADDLPPQVAFLEVAPMFGEPVFYKPGIFAAIGTLSLGAKQEPDGRISFVRVKVEKDTDLVRLAAHMPGKYPASQTGAGTPPPPAPQPAADQPAAPAAPAQ